MNNFQFSLLVIGFWVVMAGCSSGTAYNTDRGVVIERVVAIEREASLKADSVQILGRMAEKFSQRARALERKGDFNGAMDLIDEAMRIRREAINIAIREQSLQINAFKNKCKP